MNAVPPESADLIQRLRQQMILAQVRIMELEDERDELVPRVTELERLLAAAQALADRKLDEAAHLEMIRAELHAQYEHMRHMQHVTNEALMTERTQLVETQGALSVAGEKLALLTKNHEALQGQLNQTADALARESSSLVASRAESAVRAERIAQLDAELHAMKSSRSWRWTAWLRTIERALRGS